MILSIKHKALSAVFQTKQVLKQHNEKEKFEFTTEGTWQQRQSNFIRYVEQIEDATVNVTIKVDDDSVKLIRKGDINMNLHFVEGQTTTTFTIYRLDEFH